MVGVRESRRIKNARQRIRAWAGRFHDLAIDRDGRRERHLAARTSELRSRLPEGWDEEHDALDRAFHLLLRELTDRVIPIAEMIGDEELAEALQEAGIALSQLRTALHDVDSDREVAAENRKLLEKLESFEIGLRTGNLLLTSCPRCAQHFESAGRLRTHFFGAHPALDPQHILLDPMIHALNVSRAVDPCRAIIRRLSSLLEKRPRESKLRRRRSSGTKAG
jgi:hypothetical protein